MQVPYLKLNWQQRDSKPGPLTSSANSQPFSQTGQMIELRYDDLSALFIWLYLITMSRTRFRVNPHSIVCLNVNELLAQCRRHIWSLIDINGIWTHNYLVRKPILNHIAKLAKWLSCVVSTYLYGVFDCILLSCHIRDWLYSLRKYQGTPCSKQAPIWSLSGSNGIQSNNRLVRKWTLNTLAQLAK